MRLNIIKTVFFKELRETLRDRRSMVVMFGMPLLLYPLLTLGLSNLAGSRQKELSERVVRVGVENLDAAPQLKVLLAAEKSITVVESDQLIEDLKQRRLDAALHVPPDAERLARAGEDIRLPVQLDRSRSEAPMVERRLNAVLDAYQSWILEQRLGQKPNEIVSVVQDIATETQRMGKMLAMVLPNILLLTGMLGAFFPALNSTTTEREAGTLETLLVTPAGRTEILIAKGALVLLLSLATAALNLVSMSLVLWRALSSIGQMGTHAMNPGGGALTISFSSLMVAYLAAVPTLIFFASLVLVVGLFARTYREANSYATAVMMLPLISIAVSIAEPPATPGLLITPIVNTTLVMREALTRGVSAGPFLLAFGSSCLYAGIMLSVTARLFSNEQLVNPSWEPLSLKGLKARGTRPRRLPAVEEALALFALSMLLLFYLSPSFIDLSKGKFGPTDILRILAGNELLCIALPAIAAAWLLRWRWRETFSFHPARRIELGAAAMIGLGLMPLAYFAQMHIHRFWPGDPTQGWFLQRLLEPALWQYPVLTAVGIGLLAGVCEELLYRGPIQNALMRSLGLWPALIIGALLFAGAHMELNALGIRAVLGVILGWIVWRSGSIWPAMIAHGIYDLSAVGRGALYMHLGREDAGSAQWLYSGESVAQLIIGLALLAAGLWLMTRPRSTAAPEPVAVATTQ